MYLTISKKCIATYQPCPLQNCCVVPKARTNEAFALQKYTIIRKNQKKLQKNRINLVRSQKMRTFAARFLFMTSSAVMHERHF